VAELKTDALVKSPESLLAEKQAVTSKEKEFVDGLNAVLSKMGYRVRAATAGPKRRGRPPGSGAKRPGRPKALARADGVDRDDRQKRAARRRSGAGRRRQRLTSGPVQLKSGGSSGSRLR
jgi:hypothetical protein